MLALPRLWRQAGSLYSAKGFFYMAQTNLAEKAEEHFTYGQYCQWDDGERWELIDGVPYNMSPAPVRRHQGILMRVSIVVGTFLADKPCQAYFAPFDVRLPDFSEQDDSDVLTVVQPDLVVICDEKKLDDRGCRGAPDLVMEILSPSTSRKDIGVKFRLYERHGVREYWIIHPTEESLWQAAGIRAWRCGHKYRIGRIGNEH
jgi:Uma2 family endonuclease